MIRRIFLSVWGLLALTLTSVSAALSPQATVSLITVSPGEQVYDAFGHTGLWVYDPATGVDRVYGYGTYDFNAPNFYGKFVRGQLDYMLSVIDINTFLYSYQAENRTVRDQVLNLTPEQKEQVYAFLENNYLPQNRYYKYKFFFDNCTSRVRDVLNDVCQGKLQFSPPAESRSFRQWIDLYLQEHDWADFGMDLGLGDLADRKATPYESMFLPFNLRQGLEKATIQQQGRTQPFVLQTRTLFEASPKPAEAPSVTPAQVFWLLFAFVALITAWQYRNKRKGYLLDYITLGIVGLIGCVVLFLWFGTDHGVTAHNWNVAWAWPTHLLVILLLARKSPPAWLRTYFLAYCAVVAVLLVGWKWWPHELDPELIPLVLISAVRSVFLWLRLRQPMRVGKQPVIR